MRTLVGGIVCAAALLAGPSTASAAVQNISVAFGLPPTGPSATAIAGDSTEYTLTFTVPNGLNESHVVIVNAAGVAPGTIFPPGGLASEAPGHTFYTVQGANGTGGVVLAEVIRQNGNQTVVIPLAETDINVPPGGVVRVGIGYFSGQKVQNPATPGNYALTVSTATQTLTPVDTTGVSAPYQVVEGPGDLNRTGGNGQTATVGTDFGQPLSVTLVDGLGDPVQGVDVTFEAPQTGPSGTFAGGDDGGRTYTTQTDANGVATSSVLTADGQAGAWQATASADTTEPVNDVTFQLQNEAGEPSQIDLELSPTVIEANGVQTIDATATVTDSFGNPLPGQSVFFATDGGHDISATTSLGQGRYRATITATTGAGLFTVTTADTTAQPFITDTAQFLQVQDVEAPSVRIQSKPRKQHDGRRARFVFSSNAADAERFECKLDRRAWKGCKSPKTYKGLKLGKHTFRVRATDFAGNTGEPAVYRFERVKR